MRRASAWLAVIVLAGCGGSADTQPSAPWADSGTLSADGITVDLPDGWTGRILIGASGRPVLHAATFPVEANDTDEGEIAKEQIGVNGMYLNVRDLGPGHAEVSVAHFDAADFVPGSPCCHLRQASRDLGSEGERFRVTVVSGGDDAPARRYLGELNEGLASLELAPYRPEPIVPATSGPIHGFGLHANVPQGWEGGIARGEVHAGDAALDVGITEFSSPDAASFVTGRIPLTIGPAEFVHMQEGTGYETGRSFLEAGREFQLWVRTPDAHLPASSLERVNAFLASFRAEPGDFYRGRVDPATFADGEGWHTGSTGQAEIQPDGQSTLSWASTIPYLDEGFQWPPHETLAALPPDGIVLTVMLEQYGVEGGPPVRPPFRLSDFEEGSFEGLATETGPRTFRGRYTSYDLTSWALFGRAQPTQKQLDAAQAELDRLQLPTWPDWESATSAAR
jgi:hypothetical protein